MIYTIVMYVTTFTSHTYLQANSGRQTSTRGGARALNGARAFRRFVLFVASPPRTPPICLVLAFARQAIELVPSPAVTQVQVHTVVARAWRADRSMAGDAVL